MESKLKKRHNKQVKTNTQNWWFNCDGSTDVAGSRPLNTKAVASSSTSANSCPWTDISFETIGGCDLLWEAGWHHYSSVCLAAWQQSLSASSRVARGPLSSSKNAFNIRVWQPEGHAQKVTGQCSQLYEKKMHCSNCHEQNWLILLPIIYCIMCCL